MKKVMVATLLVALVCTSLFAQGGAEAAASVVTNAQKPVIFFNRQPSDPVSGVIDMEVMNWQAAALFRDSLSLIISQLPIPRLSTATATESSATSSALAMSDTMIPRRERRASGKLSEHGQAPPILVSRTQRKARQLSAARR